MSTLGSSPRACFARKRSSSAQNRRFTPGRRPDRWAEGARAQPLINQRLCCFATSRLRRLFDIAIIIANVNI
ncbi:hypothetical protein CWO90_21320 [Bradyrhizobium sp. Leo121]|nr:hypothetical protein CWO90_21320 [Bradyrhizobium sp. Leo121]